MFDYLCYHKIEDRAPKPVPVSYIRFINGAANNRKIQITIDGHMAVKTLSFRKITPYLSIPPKTHGLLISYAGGSAGKDITLDEGAVYTAAAVGSSDIDIILIPDIKIEKADNVSNIRFINLIPDSTGLDLSYTGGNLIFKGVCYKDLQCYTAVNPQKHSFQIKHSHTGCTLLTIPDTELKSQWNYTFYALGTSQKKSGLYALVLLDGSTYI